MKQDDMFKTINKGEALKVTRISNRVPLPNDDLLDAIACPTIALKNTENGEVGDLSQKNSLSKSFPGGQCIFILKPKVVHVAAFMELI